MKHLACLFALPLVFFSFSANMFANCTPSGTVTQETYVGCPQLHKDVYWQNLVA